MTSPLADVLRGARRELELDWARADDREIELTAAERHARDVIGWLNSGHVYIASKFDPAGNELQGKKLRRVRLRLFPDQELTIRDWIDVDHLLATGELVFRNVLLEKSRQIGETWAVAGVICWALHYHPVAGLAINRDGARIDDGGERNTVDSLFGRVRYIERHLDRAKLPGTSDRLIFRPFSRDPAKIENQARGSFVIGEGQTDDPGRGSTYDFVAGDEFAFLLHTEKIHAALDEACPEGKLYFSTVNGDGNAHARLAKEKPAGWRYLRLHWSGHPVYSQGLHVAGDTTKCALCKGNRDGVRWNPNDPRAHRYPGKLTSPWYDRRVIGKTDEQVANELDIDRERSKAGRVYPEWSSDIHVADREIPYEAEHHARLELAGDPGLDATSILIFQDLPLELRMVGILECGHLFGTSGVASNVAAALRDYLRDELGVDEQLLTFDWTRRIYGILDPAGHNKETSTGKSYAQELRRNGFYFGKPPTRLVKTVGISISSAKLLLEGHPKPLRVCPVKCEAFVEHVRENTWRVGPDGRVLGLNDDVHNHAMRAFAYYAVAKFPPPSEEPPKGGPDDDEPRETSGTLRRRRRARGVGTGLREGMPS